MKNKIKWYLDNLLSFNRVNFNKFDVNVQADIKINEDLTIRLFNLDDVEKLMELHNKHVVKWNYLFSKKDLIERLRDKHRCYLALMNNEIVGFMWIAVNSLYSPDLNCTFEIEKLCVISYNGYVRPDHRGMNILPSIRLYAYNDLHRDGFKSCIGFSNAINKSVKKSGLKFNPISLGYMLYGYSLGYYFIWSLLKKKCGVIIVPDKNRLHRWKGFFKKRFFKKFNSI